MKRAHYLIISCFILCTDCHSPDQALEKELATSLDNNNQFIKDKTRMLLVDIQNKNADPKTHWKVEIWNHRIEVIRKMSKKLYEYIDSLKARPEMQTRQSLNTLLDKVEHYRQTIPDIFLNDSFPAPNMRKDFEKDLKRINVEFPFAATPRMSTVSTTASPTVYEKIKNDILLSEYYLIDYIYKRTAVDYIDSYTIFVPLIHLNCSQLKIGQQLVLTAGIGAYSAATTKVTINGRVFKLNAEGYTQYTITAHKSPGKHSIPVKVEYTAPDGTSHFFTKNVEYEITR
jgi:hypothetical protein